MAETSNGYPHIITQRRAQVRIVFVTEKRCCTCGETKPAAEFAYNGKSKDKLQAACRECGRDRVRDGSNRAAVLRSRGANVPRGAKLVPPENHRCEICQSADPGNKGWMKDHCHATGNLRGWVCGKCNTGLGQFRDNVGYLQNAIAYLTRYST